MTQFCITFELREGNLAFNISNTFTPPFQFHCIIHGNQWNQQWLTLQQLYILLQNKKDNIHFIIEDLQLQILLPVGSVTRAIYLPIQQQHNQQLINLLEQTLSTLTNLGKKVQSQRQDSNSRLSVQINQIIVQLSHIRPLLHQTQQKLICLCQQLRVVNEQVIKLNRQIISCKRGLQLQQYRQQTSSQNRQQRRRKVYINQLNKYNHPQIEQLLTKECQDITKIEINDCQIKTMRFVQIFQNIQQIRLVKICLRKIQGLQSLPNLSILDLSQNQIQKIEGLNNSIQLRQLYLQHNKISKLQNVFHLSHLQVLALSDNLIEEIPKDIKMLDSIIEIRLISNNVNVLAHELLELKRLKTFSILGNACDRQTHKNKDIINKLIEAQVYTCCTLF